MDPRRKRSPTIRGGLKRGSEGRRIRIPQPEKKPLIIRGDLVRRAILRPDPSWFIIHRRGVRRTAAGVDPQEARAVSESSVRGYLQERICYRWFTSAARFVPGVDFSFQSSQEGGRMELGGMVVDFIFPNLHVAFNVQGPQHEEHLRKKKDEEQWSLLQDMGYWPVSITVAEVEEEFTFNRLMYDLFINGNVASGVSPGVILWNDRFEESMDPRFSVYEDALNELNNASEELV